MSPLNIPTRDRSLGLTDRRQTGDKQVGAAIKYFCPNAIALAPLPRCTIDGNYVNLSENMSMHV
ncbi:hypothetical protein [Synechocystis sp. PCC 7509]|uniref:hypothetical protein n=1 Tax=Synechocystis sp. PCC 7509 TaxID=927677 RepID=UPI0002F4CD9E|nr:hypothetical protein [Synechocystis sp. PCC 7509]